MKDHTTALWGTWRPAATLDGLDLSDHEMIKRAEAENRAVTVSVVTSNPALRFHQRHGFQMRKKTPEKYELTRPCDANPKDKINENH